MHVCSFYYIMSCSVPVSIGELCDKYTILQIKSEMITDAEKLAKVNIEMGLLKPLVEQFCVSQELLTNLKEINERLWDIEDSIRKKESLKQFDNEFIEIARTVYITNDARFLAKTELNTRYNSCVCEVKSYADYL
jgi:hypothetical protein